MNIGTETSGGAAMSTLMNLFIKPVADLAVLASRPGINRAEVERPIVSATL